MMKAEELRLNNYVTIDNPNHHLKLKDVVLSVTGISPNTWRGKSTHAISLEHISQEENKYYETFSQFIKYIQPIELTEEWLKKFGFEKDDMDFYTFMLIDKPSAKISISLDWQITEVCQAGYGFSVQCKCVHQLQNLYFALTGKELTIKP